MAHFAELDENNMVKMVIVVNNEVIENLPFPESEPLGIAFCQSLYGPDTKWRQTSINANFRDKYAIRGFVYDAEKDMFVDPDMAADAFSYVNADGLIIAPPYEVT
jgi:hypothetical protein